MTFLLDECVPGKTKKLLKKLGLSVTTIADLGKISSNDPEVLNLARSRKAILLTTDLDFADLILYPLGTHEGIIVLRLRPDRPDILDEVHRILESFLKQTPPAEIAKALVVIDRNKYRLRRE
jgi:predicted nuclease of predicted toxin-antitoxin system